LAEPPTSKAEEEEEKRDRDSEAVARALEQREYRIRELVESERDYVTDLAQCVQYIQFMRQEVFYISINTRRKTYL
jgi:hypothetical protein